MENPALASTPISEWPHVKFLNLYNEIGDDIFLDSTFYETAYFKNAWECISRYHNFTWCRTKEDVKKAAKHFALSSKDEALASQSVLPGNGQLDPVSSQDMPVIVRRIKDSDCFQSCDGHHRLAKCYVSGERTIEGHINVWPRVHTPVQELVMAVDRNNGMLRCIQPLPSCPELASWPQLLDCEGRLAHISKIMDKKCIPRQVPACFDTNCAYGWFVKALSDRGVDAVGMERDRASCELGWLVLNVPKKAMLRGDSVSHLESNSTTYDFMLCFDELHHYYRDERSMSAEDYLTLLVSRTAKVLFVDCPADDTTLSEQITAWATESSLVSHTENLTSMDEPLNDLHGPSTLIALYRNL
jgi:hypothetical protein